MKIRFSSRLSRGQFAWPGPAYAGGEKAAKRAGQKSKLKRQMANVKSDGILPFDPAWRDDLHFDLPFDAS
jgi:hypothetical protein